MRVFTSKHLTILSMLLLMVVSTTWSQQQSKLDIALRYVEQNKEKWDLSETDIADMVVSDQYTTKHNGVTHNYLIQRHASIEVYNAIMGIHILPNGEVTYATNRFISSLSEKINTSSPSISAYEAIEKAAAHFELSIEEPLRLIKNENSHNFLYEGGSLSNAEIKVKLAYQYLHKQKLARLAWNLAIDLKNTPDYWSVRVDAVTGEILDKNNWTVYCDFHDEDGDHHEHDGCNLDMAYEDEDSDLPTVEETLEEQNTNLMDATYNVFPIPVESPIHGDRELVVNPASPVASPFGWHDVDGQVGPEFTFTRGNNVHAFLDLDNSDVSAGDEPDGGDTLLFDFPFDDQTQEPSEYREAAVTQLFYMNNMMHDFTYAYGFDEQAGNFQQNNYGNGGNGSDYVRAHAQDGGGTNNANFGTPPDGQGGTMQMYLWDQAGGQLLQAIEPEEIARGFEVGTASYGPAVSTIPVEGFLAEAFDDTFDPSFGCEEIVNVDDVTGKVAMVDRGGCFFEQKTANVEAAGAIALIICNFEESTPGMAGVAEIPDPGIPTVSLKASDCALLRSVIDVGVYVSIGLPDNSGPAQVDGDFDNGIIAHEYGHGISNRLTGGPLAAGCLNNDEQMGEGWSDLFALFTTVKPGDTGDMPRGIGNYALRAGVNGGGIRRLPYTTNLDINDQTYNDVVGTAAPHPLGEVWVDAVWDMYWALVDAYGFDEDLINGTGGNNIAVQLVMDGMKLQPCNPGFLDGRDAILKADSINNDAANSCLIWEAFARRGLGFSADQGSSFDRNDGSEGYDPKPQCIKELKITKAVTPTINAGDDITVNLRATNHKGETVTGVTIMDEIPAGLSYVAGSATGATATVDGNMITFDLGEMAQDDVINISYVLSSTADILSLRTYFDDMEAGDDDWEFDAFDGIDVFEWSDVLPYSGDYCWYVASTDNENDQILQNLEPIMVTGSQPVLRFYHSYESPSGVVGGLVQISTDGGTIWEDAGDLMFRNGYPGPLEYFAFTIPNLNAFSGNSNGYIPTYVDLSSYAGQEIKIRFRYGSDDNGGTGALLGLGWFIDDFEMMDLVNYNGEACITSIEGDEACTLAPEWGTLVESNGVTDVEDPEQKTVLAVYPNPANDFINVALTTESAEDITLELLSLDGKLIRQKAFRTNGDYQLIPIRVEDLASGFYFVRVNTPNEIAVEKIVIK